MSHTFPILGVSINLLPFNDVVRCLNGFLTMGQHHVVTVNPEFLIAARKDREFNLILNQAELAVADGVGVVFAGYMYGKKIPRIPGVELMGQLVEQATERHMSIYFLGGKAMAAKMAAAAIAKRNPQIQSVGWHAGGIVTSKGVSDHDQEIVDNINEVRPDILFVAFGQVKQEKWIAKNLKKMPSVRVAIGVGGGLDYVAGLVVRAPKFIRIIGLEWLFRLIIEPKRLFRIFNAAVLFSFWALKERLWGNLPASR